MSRYRRRLEIIADVLGVASGGAKKTKIMYQANLSYRLLTHYLKDVIEIGLVKTKDGTIYELTEKGSDFLREFKGYRERRVEVEGQLNDIQDEKVMLENRFLSARNMDAVLKNCLGKKGEKKKAT